MLHPCYDAADTCIVWNIYNPFPTWHWMAVCNTSPYWLHLQLKVYECLSCSLSKLFNYSKTFIVLSNYLNVLPNNFLFLSRRYCFWWLGIFRWAKVLKPYQLSFDIDGSALLQASTCCNINYKGKKVTMALNFSLIEFTSNWNGFV